MSLITKRRRHRSLIFVFLGGMLLVAGCESACKKAMDTDPLGKNGPGVTGDMVAVVNGVSLPKAELETQHKRAAERYVKTGRPSTEDFDRKLRASILRKMIDDEVLRQLGEKEGVKVDRIERVDALEKFKTKMGGQKGFEAYLKHQNLTEEQVFTTVLADLQREKLLQKLSAIDAPTEEDIKQHYHANPRLYSVPEMVHARHILLKLAENDPKEKADLVLKKAIEIIKEASLPDASFVALVQKYSEGPSTKTGGDLGFFPRGRMVKSFEDAAFNAPLKKPVGPIRTEFGYHIIYVEEKSPTKTAPLEDVRSRIVELLTRGKRSLKAEELLSSLRKSAKVKVNDYSMTQEEYLSVANPEKVANKEDKKKVP